MLTTQKARMCNSHFCTTGLTQSRGIVDYLKMAKDNSKKVSTVGCGKVVFGRPCRIKGRTFPKTFSFVKHYFKSMYSSRCSCSGR